MAVGTADAGNVQPSEVQRGNVSPVTQKVTEGELEGYHGEGLKPATCNLRHTREIYRGNLPAAPV